MIPTPPCRLRAGYPQIIDYAASKGVQTMLYVDRRCALRQLDALCNTYSEWGAAGISSLHVGRSQIGCRRPL